MIPYKVLRRSDVRPYMTYALIGINILVFLWEVTVPDSQLFRTFYEIAVVPCQVLTGWFLPGTWLDVLRSMFLHAGLLHILGNMWYLVLFGPSVEEYFGKWGFLGFYIGMGVAAVLTHVGMAAIAGGGVACPVPTGGLPPFPPQNGYIPLVGASGAIAGLMGAFILLYPGTNVRVSIPIFRVLPINAKLPALVVLGFWFLLQLMSGLASIGPSGARPGGGVAFWAHIGGFAVGAIVIFITMMFKPAPDQNLTDEFEA